MRIAYVCADRGVPVFGRKGGSIHVQEVLRSFRDNGVEVELFAARIGGEPPTGLERVAVHRLPRISGGDPVDKARAALAANEVLRAALDAAGPFDFVYERHALWSFAGMEHARGAGVPGLLEVNAPLVQEQRRYRQLVLEDEAERAEARAFAAASALLAVSDGVAAYLRSRSGTGGRVFVVPNGVDPARFAPGGGPVSRDPARPFTAGFVGTLRPWHGVGDLIEAFARSGSLRERGRLLIVGDGPTRSTLEAQASDLGLDRAAVFRGALAPELIPPVLTSMDVAVAPYPPLEGFYFSPLKLFEYMAAGRAIVAAAIGQVRDVIADGVTGLLYPPGDTAALSAALQRLMADRALRRRLGEEARRVAARDHTWQSVTRRILDLAGRCGAGGALRGVC